MVTIRANLLEVNIKELSSCYFKHVTLWNWSICPWSAIGAFGVFLEGFKQICPGRSILLLETKLRNLKKNNTDVN